MSSLEDLEDLEGSREQEQDRDQNRRDGSPGPGGAGKEEDAEMKDLEDKGGDIDPEILNSTPQDIINRGRLLENDIRIMRQEHQRLSHEQQAMNKRIDENLEKIENNRYVCGKLQSQHCTMYLLHFRPCRQLPYLVGNVVELLDMDPTAEEAEDGANVDLDAVRKGKSAVIKTSTRQTIFLPLIGIVDPEKLRPGDLIGVHKDSYLVLDTLPAEYDSRVKAMEVDEKPTETYTDIGGLDKQIEELVEAVVWPMREAEKFKKIGIKPPKGTVFQLYMRITID